MKHLKFTVAIEDAIAAITRADAMYVAGFDSASIVELPRLALATAVLDAYNAQGVRTVEQQARLSMLPKRAPVAVVEVTLRPKRRRA